ncbi:MAG: glutamate-cysteine ligase family protein [Halobacteriales archaeon]
MRLGIEVEYWLADEDGALVPADGIISTCEGVDPEMIEPLLEVKTPPCDSFEELVDAFVERLGAVRDEARSRGRRLVPLGTPLTNECFDHRSKTRIEVQSAVLGDALAHAGHCAGTHIHFEQDEPLDQIRVLTALDPAFALVNTSPYYRGERLTECARPYVYRRMCYASFEGHGQLWRYPDTVEEWRGRVDKRYERFVEEATERGVDSGTVEDRFSPADALWTPVCLRDDLGTVEWRTPDAAPPLDLCRLVDDVSDVVEKAVEEGTEVDGAVHTDGTVAVPPFGTLTDYVDVAIRDGLSDGRVERYLSRFGFDTDEYGPVSERIPEGLSIDNETARSLRLRAADRLDRELRNLREEGYEAVDEAPSAVSD